MAEAASDAEAAQKAELDNRTDALDNFSIVIFIE
ncbi:MAG: hypothetical protein BWY75_02154 [bacterium ADurb.Bin425]|nr:MAG: hypothetical protein BWY75_02154 [bacterium ADurb.Bin425]